VCFIAVDADPLGALAALTVFLGELLGVPDHRVDVEADLDLRDAARSRRDAGQVEGAAATSSAMDGGQSAFHQNSSPRTPLFAIIRRTAVQMMTQSGDQINGEECPLNVVHRLIIGSRHGSR
jgi:hypothetical protein